MSVITQKTEDTPLVPVYAAIDVGSNNVRMDLYAVNSKGIEQKVKIGTRTTHKCKLGEGISKRNPSFKKQNFELALNAMFSFSQILNTYDIEPENVRVVMTAAARAVSRSEQGRRDIAKFNFALGNHNSFILTEGEEALLDGEAAKIACPTLFRNHQGLDCSAAFAAIGGGSIQLGIIDACGLICDPVSLPYGIYPLIEESGDDTQKAGKILNQILRNHYPDHQHKTLLVLGRNWRALGEVVCDAEPRMIQGREQIQEILKSLTHRKVRSFDDYSRRVKDCAPILPLSAAMLRRVAKHFEADRIVFLETSIRDALAHYIHAQYTPGFTPPPGLERLFSPSAPLPALRV